MYLSFLCFQINTRLILYLDIFLYNLQNLPLAFPDWYKLRSRNFRTIPSNWRRRRLSVLPADWLAGPPFPESLLSQGVVKVYLARQLCAIAEPFRAAERSPNCSTEWCMCMHIWSVSWIWQGPPDKKRPGVGIFVKIAALMHSPNLLASYVPWKLKCEWLFYIDRGKCARMQLKRMD